MTHQPPQDFGVPVNLDTLTEAMQASEAYRRAGHTARTILRAADLRIVVLVMKAGSRLAEHRAKETASVHVLSGRVRLGLPNGHLELSAGQLLMLEPNVRHDVEATSESTLLLTLGWKQGD